MGTTVRTQLSLVRATPRTRSALAIVASSRASLCLGLWRYTSAPSWRRPPARSRRAKATATTLWIASRCPLPCTLPLPPFSDPLPCLTLVPLLRERRITNSARGCTATQRSSTSASPTGNHCLGASAAACAQYGQPLMASIWGIWGVDDPQVYFIAFSLHPPHCVVVVFFAMYVFNVYN